MCFFLFSNNLKLKKNMSLFKMYEVGGCVRDEILGLKSKDIDYVAVPNDELIKDISSAHTMFGILEGYLREEGFELFLVTPDCFTIRAKFPKNHKHSGVADFVMARKEVGYIPGTRQPMVVPGTLRDDLIRRDFTLNALAKDEDGNIIDIFDGMWALDNGILITPQDAITTMSDDPLRLLRAFRFSITKGFDISPRIWETCYVDSIIEKLEKVVSQERIRDEVYKMMKHDTLKTLDLFEKIKKSNPKILEIMFGRGMWLKPTTEL
jgi:tRNA nucleotidyltransferase/poly(A) polymerase